MKHIFLACCRLAPVQMTTWGHSETSGISTIDYYVSSEYFETSNAQNYYSEKLLTLPSLSTYYYLHSYTFQEYLNFDFKLPKNKNLYICPTIFI